jgi:hypothetical protein
MTLEYEINEAAQERAEQLAVGMAHDMADTIVAERLETAIDNRLFETARNFIQAGVSLDVIARSTGLSLEQVERLKESL